MKKFLKIILVVLLIVIIAVAALWRGEIASIRTVHRVGDNPYLYSMQYKASYDLDDVVASDIGSNKDLLAYVVKKIGKGIPIRIKSAQVKEDESEHCTSFQARNAEGDGYLFGRNYDFYKNPSLVTISRPKKGYASIAVSDLSHVGYSLEKLPDSFMKKLLCVAAIYAPLDGVNEKGLCTSIMALPKQAAQQDTPKHDIGTTILMRLFLDRCATVDEALALVESVDVKHDVSVGSGYHYMVADAGGKCAVIEFDMNDGWKTMVVEKPDSLDYMLVTNHLLAPKYYTTEPDPAVGNPHSKSWWRYETVDKYLSAHNGAVTPDEALECLASVHWKDLVWEDGTVEDTQYTCLYDQKDLTLRIRSWSDYDTVHAFSLND